MSTALPFEATGRENNDFGALPAGQYTATVVEFENKLTKDGSGSYAQIKFKIDSGENAGRFIWSRHTTANANATAVQIGRRQIEELAYAALGEGRVLRDLAQLAAKTVVLELVVKNNPTYGPSNEVKRFYPVDNGLPAGQAAPPAAQASAAPQRPWEQ